MTSARIDIDCPLTWQWMFVVIAVVGGIYAIAIAARGLKTTFEARRGLGLGAKAISVGAAGALTFAIVGFAGIACLVFTVSEAFKVREVTIEHSEVHLYDYLHVQIGKLKTADMQSIVFVKDNPYNGYGEITCRSGRVYVTARIKDSRPVDQLRAIVFRRAE